MIQVAGRQRTLADRYVQQVLLVRAGLAGRSGHDGADPAQERATRCSTAARCRRSRATTTRRRSRRQTDPGIRAQLEQELRLVHDLTVAGSGRAGAPPLPTARSLRTSTCACRTRSNSLRVLAALTSNVSLNASRAIGRKADQRITSLSSSRSCSASPGSSRRSPSRSRWCGGTPPDGALPQHRQRLDRPRPRLRAGGCRYASPSVERAARAHRRRAPRRRGSTPSCTRRIARRSTRRAAQRAPAGAPVPRRRTTPARGGTWRRTSPTCAPTATSAASSSTRATSPSASSSRRS